MGYPVAKSNCSSCHDPHGSGTRGILWGKPHQPVANKMCSQCHLDPSSPDALKTRKAGGRPVPRLPQRKDERDHGQEARSLACCGQDVVPELPQSARLQGERPPEGAASRPLRRMPHGHHRTAGQIRREAQAGRGGELHQVPYAALVEQRLPVGQHESDQPVRQLPRLQKHSSHPIGEKAIDKRNRNITLDCSSCHAPHGSEHKRFTWYDVKMDLCVQCHEQYKR